MEFNGTFEEGIARLEEIASKLSSGSATLDESLGLFTEASELIVYCEELLKKTKLTVEEIAVRFDEVEE